MSAGRATPWPGPLSGVCCLLFEPERHIRTLKMDLKHVVLTLIIDLT